MPGLGHRFRLLGSLAVIRNFSSNTFIQRGIVVNQRGTINASRLIIPSITRFQTRFVSETSGSENDSSSTSPSWKVNMLYDSECPLCMHEVRFLQKRDLKRGTSSVKFTDICDHDYDPALNGHVTYEEGMKKIHAVLPDGTVIKGLAVFEAVYDAVGLGWIYSFAKIPFLFRFGEKVYDFWARKRMWLTGRPELEEVFEQRKKTLEHLRKARNLEEKMCDVKYKE